MKNAIIMSLATVLTILLAACAIGDTVSDRQPGQQLVCHKGEETQAVSTADMFVHEQHGDSLGPCPHEG
jgi:hypothetical protein